MLAWRRTNHVLVGSEKLATLWIEEDIDRHIILTSMVRGGSFLNNIVAGDRMCFSTPGARMKTIDGDVFFNGVILVLYFPRKYTGSVVPWTSLISMRYHLHHVAPSAWISLILSCHPSLSSTASGFYTELLYVYSSWSPCLCSSMWRGPQEYISYELIPNSLAVSCTSGSSNFDSFRDGWQVAVQQLLCGVIPPGLVQYCLQHSCVVTVKLFLHAFR